MSSRKASPSHVRFPCSYCWRAFARRDHLARHVRTHTRETPYCCDRCGRGFARRDLLRRHDLRHHKLQVDSASRLRVARACARCAASKLKCSDQRPCQPCAAKALVCSSPSPFASPAPPPPAAAVPSSNPDGDGDFAVPPPLATGPDSNHMPPRDEDTGPGSSRNPFADLLQTLFAGEAQQQGFLPESHAASLDVDKNLFDLSFADVLPGLGAPAALQSFETLANGSNPESTHSIAVSDPQSILSAEGARAFQASIWHWIPSSADTRLANEPDPSLVPANLSSAEPEAHQIHPDVLAKHVGTAERDRILSVILDQCEKSSLVRIATSFPAPHVLEQLLQTALHFQSVGSPLGWIHIPTFSMQSVSNELLCALVSCGAHHSPAAPVQALGAAMSDLMFHAILQQWSRNNATTRNLQLAQAYALAQHLLLWAGSKRRMEFGEGIAQPLITIARRCGMLQEIHSPLETPSLDDSSYDLETKWQEWVRKESTIRLAHQIFVNDVQTSMTLLINPLLSCTEMTLSLPADDSLWRASTAEEWRARWISLMPSTSEESPPYSLSSLIRKAFALLSAHTMLEQPHFHSESTHMLLLYGLWDPVWSCQRTASWLREDCFQYQPLPTGFSAQQELVMQALRQLDPLKSASASAPRMPNSHVQRERDDRLPEKLLLFHYLNLGLCAPIKRFVQLAGKESEAEAHQAFLLLQEWSQAREGRRALWHAAQIYRNAYRLPSWKMRNSFVVALYHAGLTLWSFGVVVGLSQLRPHSQNPSFRSDAENKVYLDGDMSSSVERFIACNAYSPTITGMQDCGEGVIAVATSPGAAIRVAIRILDSTPWQQNHDRPLFTYMVARLMHGLADAVHCVGLD